MSEEKTKTIDSSGMWTALDAEPGILPYDACLVLVYGSDVGRRYPVRDEVTIGREELNDVTIDQPSVSRFHARVFRRDDSWFVTDIGSTNGTYVNGTEVSGDVELANGDLIKLGCAILKIIFGSNIEAQFYEEIYRLTILDGLTGTHNKRYLHDFLEREIARSQRWSRPLSLAFFDIDHFNQLNETYGHVAGDHVIEVMVRQILERVTREQLFARFGGEEFALVLPEIDSDGACEVCEEIRQLVAGHTFEFDSQQITTSISIGVVSLQDHPDLGSFLQAADQALSRAKQGGRNRVVAG